LPVFFRSHCRVRLIGFDRHPNTPPSHPSRRSARALRRAAVCSSNQMPSRKQRREIIAAGIAGSSTEIGSAESRNGGPERAPLLGERLLARLYLQRVRSPRSSKTNCRIWRARRPLPELLKTDRRHYAAVAECLMLDVEVVFSRSSLTPLMQEKETVDFGLVDEPAGNASM